MFAIFSCLKYRKKDVRKLILGSKKLEAKVTFTQINYLCLYVHLCIYILMHFIYSVLFSIMSFYIILIFQRETI